MPSRVAVWVEETDEVFFVSRCGGVKTGPGEIQPNNHIYRVVLKDTPANSSFEDKVTKVKNLAFRLLFTTPLKTQAAGRSQV